MRLRRRVVALVLGMLAAFGCSKHQGRSAPEKDDATSACDAVEACTSADTGAQCRKIFSSSVVSSSCLEAVEDASCDEHASKSPAYFDTCFQSCSTPGTTCVAGGTLATCAEVGGSLHHIEVRCSEVCKGKNLVFSGVCDSSYRGKTSDASDACWCIEPSGMSSSNAPKGSAVAEADSGNVSAACAALEACGVPCTFVDDGYVLSKKCVSAIVAETCPQRTDDPPLFYKECFPTCPTEALYCNGDSNLVSCMYDTATDSTRWYTGSCASICVNEGGTWDGTCTANSDGSASCGCGL